MSKFQKLGWKTASDSLKFYVIFTLIFTAEFSRPFSLYRQTCHSVQSDSEMRNLSHSVQAIARCGIFLSDVIYYLSSSYPFLLFLLKFELSILKFEIQFTSQDSPLKTYLSLRVIFDRKLYREVVLSYQFSRVLDTMVLVCRHKPITRTDIYSNSPFTFQDYSLFIIRYFLFVIQFSLFDSLPV